MINIVFVVVMHVWIVGSVQLLTRGFESELGDSQ